MILDIYNDSIKYSIKNSKSLLYFGLTLFSTFIIWIAYILILIHYQDANLNLKFASLIVPSLLTLIPIFLFLGYEYRILEISTHGMINGTDKVPEFNNLKEMLINGVKIFLVKFVYFAVPIIILAVTTTPFLDNISGWRNSQRTQRTLRCFTQKSWGRQRICKRRRNYLDLRKLRTYFQRKRSTWKMSCLCSSKSILWKKGR